MSEPTNRLDDFGVPRSLNLRNRAIGAVLLIVTLTGILAAFCAKGWGAIFLIVQFASLLFFPLFFGVVLLCDGDLSGLDEHAM